MLLVGAGPMAIEYSRVFQGLKIEHVVVGRGGESARKFRETCGKEVVCGGLSAYIDSGVLPHSDAVVAVGVDELADTCISLLAWGVKRILVEKPGALDQCELDRVLEARGSSNVYIAYNRRYFDSVINAKRMLSDDGGVLSFHFEFTEWSDRIAPLSKSQKSFDQWLYVNSTHVIDLAFYLGGEPLVLNAMSKGGGELGWTDSPSRFCGSGITETGALFSYIANWNAPGRWSLDFASKNIRCVLSPMEELKIVRRNSVVLEDVKSENLCDEGFKPGLLKMVSEFIATPEKLMTLEQQVGRWRVYGKIRDGAGYG